MIKKIINISEIIDLYDIFILDQWGVMHDGKNGYDHAIKSVEKLIEENKKLIIISNSSKRKISTVNNLKYFGFNKNHFIEAMTSGEMIWQELSNSINAYGRELKNCFHIYNKSKKDGIDFRKDLNKYNFVSNIKESDFILACTPFENTEPVDYIPILKEALDLKLIMFCANPDYLSIEQDNKKNIFCMGTIADLYLHMGGKVIILGKPSKEIYLESTKKIAELDLTKVIAIGDSMEHDILGANNFGIDSLLISSGIHKDLFQNSFDLDLKMLENNEKWDFKPTYLSNYFSI